MSITREESALLDKRDELSPIEHEVIDAVFQELAERSEKDGLKLANDDRAARLEAALVRYIIESKQ